MMKTSHYDPKIHHRRSIRMPCYDYSSPGVYYVTICLEELEPHLQNPEIRTIIEDNWKALPVRFPGIQLDIFVIMPDYLHFILRLNPSQECHPTLDDVVGAFKSLTARAALRYLRDVGHTPANKFWQRGYYERVLRNEDELQQKRKYILDNPVKEMLKNQ